MEREVITAADIEKLKSASKKLKSGEIILATLETGTKKTPDGLKVTKRIVKEDPNNICEIINFPGVSPLQGEGIIGTVIIDAFKNAQKNTDKKQPFSLKRSFFHIANNIIKNINDMRLNSSQIVFFNDEFGRVYLIADNKRLYLNKNQTHVITEDGFFADLTFIEDNGLELHYYDKDEALSNPNFINFNYLYISPEAARQGEELIKIEEERQQKEFISSLSTTEEILLQEFLQEEKQTYDKGKVVDFLEYRRKMEEQGPKR